MPVPVSLHGHAQIAAGRQVALGLGQVDALRGDGDLAAGRPWRRGR
jgi:hypothetical protein